jgi:hypothetical protein
VALPAAEPIHQPGIDRPETKLSILRPTLTIRDSIEQPSKFCGREVRIHNEARATTYVGRVPGMNKFSAVIGRTSTLPYDRVRYRFAGISIPHHDRFALVGDTDRRYLVQTKA